MLSNICPESPRNKSTISKLVACPALEGANTGLTPKRGTENLTQHYYHWKPLTCGCSFCLFILTTRKRVCVFFYANLLGCIIFFQLISIIFGFFLFLPTVST